MGDRAALLVYDIGLPAVPVFDPSCKLAKLKAIPVSQEHACRLTVQLYRDRVDHDDACTIFIKHGF